MLGPARILLLRMGLRVRHDTHKHACLRIIFSFFYPHRCASLPSHTQISATTRTTGVRIKAPKTLMKLNWLWEFAFCSIYNASGSGAYVSHHIRIRYIYILHIPYCVYNIYKVKFGQMKLFTLVCIRQQNEAERTNKHKTKCMARAPWITLNRLTEKKSIRVQRC